MMYTRAQGVDLDSWKTRGWTAQDLLPLAKKLETFHQDEEGIDKSKHGYDGPIHVSNGGFRGKSEMEFMETVKKMGYKEIVDLQDLDQVGGFSVSPRVILRSPKLSYKQRINRLTAMATICFARWKTTRCRSSIYPPTASRWTAPKPSYPCRIQGRPRDLQ